MSIAKRFWVYIKNWACLKNLSMLEPNFEKADGLGNRLAYLSIPKLFWVHLKNLSIPKNLRALKTYFEKADGLGISLKSTQKCSLMSFIAHRFEHFEFRIF